MYRLMKTAGLVNKMLKTILDAEENMTFWRHSRLMNSPLDVLDKMAYI